MNKIVSIRGTKLLCKICDTSFSMFVGLMFAPRDLNCAFFTFRQSGKYPIHSLFVPKRFSAVYLDEGFNVVDRINNIPPWKLYISHSGDAKYLFEIFSDTHRSNIKGDEIHAIYSSLFE